MRSLEQMETIAEVEERIDEIERNCLGLRHRVRTTTFSEEELDADPKLSAMHDAIARLDELIAERDAHT